MALALLLLAALQQPAAPVAPTRGVEPLPPLDQTFAGAPSAPSRTSPPGGDTTGYWQQRADYTVVATLDEARGVLSARGTLTYVNRSPDTLRELFLHQHLNAFRPHSKWSATDHAEGRVRFQFLADPLHAYERFIAPPTVDGTPVRAEYPGAPDSTVVRLALPRPLAPGDSVVVGLAWEARPSTLPRRQARSGRSFDFAQWFPKVAVYDRGGWQPHALVPAGEFYGEFGTFDVTLVVPDDQVIGATGVPVEGDPGWARVSRTGPPRLAAQAYRDLPRAPDAEVPAGFRRVRFHARGVHHFGISMSPDYRYEGGVHVRRAEAPGGRFATWDTVGVHVLHRLADDTTWGGGRVVSRTIAALAWLERIFGPYGYPQMTVLHRIETGGTEFPMLQMNGSPSLGLNLHEGGHVYAYGLLASNEWQSGWMDEGLTSYQTAWALGETPQELARAPLAPPVGPPVTDSVARARRGRVDTAARDAAAAVRAGRMEPIGTRGDRFSTFATYNAMVYGRASQMYGALRDAIGDDAFAAFLRDYYARWAFRHVDEAAMRASAERAAGADLGWFFDQWVRRTGYVDYALRDVRTRRAGAGWLTTATLVRTGGYRHPVAVGALGAGGAWTVARGDASRDVQTVTLRTAERPVEIRLDPHGTGAVASAGFYVFRDGERVPPPPAAAAPR